MGITLACLSGLANLDSSLRKMVDYWCASRVNELTGFATQFDVLAGLLQLSQESTAMRWIQYMSTATTRNFSTLVIVLRCASVIVGMLCVMLIVTPARAVF